MGLSQSLLVSSEEEILARQNLRSESYFSSFNGIYLGLAVMASPVVAVRSFSASPLELTILVNAFPVGAFLGPVWASWAVLGHEEARHADGAMGQFPALL